METNLLCTTTNVYISGSQLGQSDLSKILTEMHNMLHLLVKRVGSTERELKQMKENLTSSSSDSRPQLKKAKDVPRVVRVTVTF